MSTLAALGEGLVELTLNEPAELASGERVLLGPGGDAANICVMAARLGGSSRLLGRVGDDGFGQALLRYLADQGVEVTNVKTDRGAATGLYLNEKQRDGGHRFSYWRRGSAGSRLQPDDLTPRSLHGLRALVITGVTLAVSRSSARTALSAASAARHKGIRVACVLNHRAALGGYADELAALASESEIVIGSSEDLEALFGTREEGVRRLLAGDAEPEREIAITDGAKPAMLISDGRCSRQAVPALTAKDTAGAGDAFAGAYLASRLLGRGPARALAYAVSASALSVRRHGCALSYPTAEETERFLGTLAAPEATPFGEGVSV